MRRPAPTLTGALPYRGLFGDPRPQALQGLSLPPLPMPSHQGMRPLKAWRYVGVFTPDLMLCLANVRIGRARQCFWAIWDRRAGRLYEHTRLGGSAVTLGAGRARISDGEVEVALELDESAGVETVCPSGASYAWTRKQGGIAARGTVSLAGVRCKLRGRAVIDDTAAYYERHTSWCWSAGVGTARDGRELAWNLVQGVNDPPGGSERTIWIGGEALEPGPVRFDADLSAVGGLRFSAETVRERRENLGLIRSRYRQPFGTFAGQLMQGLELAEGFGVMESHDVWW